MMNLKLYEDLRDILRAPWVGSRKESSKQPLNVDARQMNETRSPLATDFFADRKQKMIQNQKQLQRQDEQDKEKIKGGISGW